MKHDPCKRMFKIDECGPKIEGHTVFRSTRLSILFPTKVGPRGKLYHPHERRRGDWFNTFEEAKRALLARLCDEAEAHDANARDALARLEKAAALEPKR